MGCCSISKPIEEPIEINEETQNEQQTINSKQHSFPNEINEINHEQKFQNDNINVNDDNNMYIVGYNESYEFGLNHNQNINTLTGHNLMDHEIILKTIHCLPSSTVFEDINGYYWCAGYDFYGINNNISKTQNYVKSLKQITYFTDNNISIHKICDGISCYASFWISENHKLYVSGTNDNFQLGLPDNNDRNKPTLVEYLNNVIYAKGSCDYTIALCNPSLSHHIIVQYWLQTHNNDVCNVPKDIIKLITKFSESFNELFTTLGKGVQHNKWQRINNFSDKQIVQIAVSWMTVIFLEANGRVWRCGWNYNGIAVPKLIEIDNWKQHFFGGIRQIECGRQHYLAVDYNGNVYAWGSNQCGQCGVGSRFSPTYKPEIIPSLEHYDVMDIKCGAFHSYVKTEDDKHFLFGRNNNNECSLLDDEKFAIRVPLCINGIIEKVINGKTIKNVYLGDMNTIITVNQE